MKFCYNFRPIGRAIKNALKAQNIIAQRRVSEANGTLGVRFPHHPGALKAQNESWRVALSGRRFPLLATIPKAPLRLPWAMCELPLRGVFSNQTYPN